MFRYLSSFIGNFNLRAALTCMQFTYQYYLSKVDKGRKVDFQHLLPTTTGFQIIVNFTARNVFFLLLKHNALN